MSWSPRYYLPSFVEIGLPVLERKISKGFLQYIIFHFISLYLKAFKHNLVQIGKVVSEKIWFEFLYVHDLGPRSSNDLDLQYSHIFIYSIRCLLLPTFKSLAAIVSVKSTVLTFSYRKAYVTIFDLAVKEVKVTPGS